MKQQTRQLWADQDRHEGDRWRLFRAVADAVDVTSVLYPGCFVDIAPSFVFESVTYVDCDRRTPRFFADEDGVREIIAAHLDTSIEPDVRFIHADYTDDLGLPSEGFDLLVSLYAGFVSEHCTEHLRIGGTLLVNPSHGDAAMASIDSRYRLSGVVIARAGDYHVGTAGLDAHLVPTQPIALSVEHLHETGRGIGYTKSAFAYLFERIG